MSQLKINQTIRCTIHEVVFGCAVPADAPSEVKDLALPECPVCAHKAMHNLMMQRDNLKARCDILVAAIEVKTAVLLENYSQ